MPGREMLTALHVPHNDILLSWSSQAALYACCLMQHMGGQLGWQMSAMCPQEIRVTDSSTVAMYALKFTNAQ